MCSFVGLGFRVKAKLGLRSVVKAKDKVKVAHRKINDEGFVIEV